jgi:hypothetical protein
MKLEFYLIKEVNMGISYNYWGELAEELKPYVARVKSGEMTYREFLEVYDQKYHAFVMKYMVIK